MLAFLAAILFSGTGPAIATAEPASRGNVECRQSSAMTVNDVLACHVEAVGGASAFDALQNVRIGVEVIEPAFTVDGDYRATRNMMRVDVFADKKRVFSEGIDRDGGWQQNGEGAEIRPVSEDGFDALKRGIEFNVLGLNDVESRGHSASLVGRALVDGVNYHVIKLMMSDGFERHFYINPVSWMVERIRETSALHPDLHPEKRPAEVIQGGFSQECGVLHPMWTRKIDLRTEEEIQRTRVTSFACNVAPASMEIMRGDLQG